VRLPRAEEVLWGCAGGQDEAVRWSGHGATEGEVREGDGQEGRDGDEVSGRGHQVR